MRTVPTATSIKPSKMIRLRLPLEKRDTWSSDLQVGTAALVDVVS